MVGNARANRQNARAKPVAQVVLQPEAQFFTALGLKQFLDAFANFAQRQGAQKQGFVGRVDNQSSTAASGFGRTSSEITWVSIR
jgi:hypothetical protein